VCDQLNASANWPGVRLTMACLCLGMRQQPLQTDISSHGQHSLGDGLICVNVGLHIVFKAIEAL
jgi:hypothetical protein